MKAKSFQKFAAKEVLKDYEDKKKIEIAKATEEARKESKDSLYLFELKFKMCNWCNFLEFCF
jgi:hypothetical protein